MGSRPADEAVLPPHSVAGALKAGASRALEAAGHDAPRTRRWTRGASTRYLWTQDAVEAAVDYVLHRQGPPIAVYPSDDAA